MWEIACISDKGPVREKNDDRVLVNNSIISCGKHIETADRECIAVICDGVGGEQYGDEAAEIVVKEFAKISIEQLNKESIYQHIESVNKKVISAQRIDAAHSWMATTVAGIAIKGDDYVAFNVGDTRVYRYRKPYISQLSTDHSLFQENIFAGIPTGIEYRHVLTRYIGGNTAEAAVVDGTDSIGNNDIFVLCSDGIWDVVSDIDLEKVLSEDLTADEMCQKIFNMAIANSTKDNISLAIVRRI